MQKLKSFQQNFNCLTFNVERENLKLAKIFLQSFLHTSQLLLFNYYFVKIKWSVKRLICWDLHFAFFWAKFSSGHRYFSMQIGILKEKMKQTNLAIMKLPSGNDKENTCRHSISNQPVSNSAILKQMFTYICFLQSPVLKLSKVLEMKLKSNWHFVHF